MKDWEYTFDSVSKAEWISQIEKDLRQRPVESLTSEWWSGEPLIPLVHPEDESKDMIKLPDGLFSYPPRIAEWIETGSLPEKAVNHRILEALSQGAQIIILNPETPMDHFPASWVSGVHLEMAEVAVQAQDIGLNELKSLFGNVPDTIGIRLQRQITSPPFFSIVHLLKENRPALKNLTLVYEIPSSGIWDVEVAGILNKLLEDLDAWTRAGMDIRDFFLKCKFFLAADPQYFKHIIQTRVLHLLWANLKKYFEIDSIEASGEYLECHIVQLDTELSDRYLIRASMSGLAAALCGTSTLCIHHSGSPDQPGFYKRINRNIHHLLNLESGMYKGSDPLAGAYAIDYHTRKWTQQIWDKLLF